ncbi:glyoxalase [Sphingobium jiangsuense]|uniref:VOC domain-containing protein n=1 Tax=Sphingobium jiangsuense TaxID=870476 RepID=A0A7W6FNP2_9SPHN|nr:glyoxalase [Sphingobium jiangsuense]MBB3925018.1 hypothetical protein [Sphingobium jiangsuense]GLT00152.1 glyoxalase [Sphingobium jiangsuense]
MAIIGIESLIYEVSDLALCVRFFEDFGLGTAEREGEGFRFGLTEGSSVVLRPRGGSALPPSPMEGDGVRQVVWGVDSEKSLEALVAGLAADIEVRRAQDGTAHFLTPFGIAMGLRVFDRKPVVYAPDPVNAPGRVNRLNQHRKWRERARPKVINHAVWAIPEYEAGYAFMRDRLNFRLSDHQRGFGMYLRADGSINHHNILLLNANAPFPGMDGKVRFHHANFGVEDIDEIMTGANHMTRKGWKGSHLGLGRHRIDSALFYYLPCPAGGEAEYGADADYVDDNWVPRDWVSPLFAFAHFTHDLPAFLRQAPSWDVRYLTQEAPQANGGTN